eukprot:23314-Amorphochlora_amoeboformis.AAC.2
MLAAGLGEFEETLNKAADVHIQPDEFKLFIASVATIQDRVDAAYQRGQILLLGMIRHSARIVSSLSTEFLQQPVEDSTFFGDLVSCLELVSVIRVPLIQNDPGAHVELGRSLVVSIRR